MLQFVTHKYFPRDAKTFITFIVRMNDLLVLCIGDVS